MTTTIERRTRRPLAPCWQIAAVLLLATTAACSSSADPGAGGTTSTSAAPEVTAPATSTTVAASTTVLRADPAEADATVFYAYVEGMDAFAEAATDPVNPDDPALGAALVDPLLSELRNLASTWRGFGQAVRLPADSMRRTTPLDVEVDGDTAVLEVCSVDDSVLYEPASGRVLNDEVSTSRIRAELHRIDGVWRLASRERVESWEGVAGCALD